MEFNCGETIMTCPLKGGALCDKDCAWAMHFIEKDQECGVFATWDCAIQVMATYMINSDDDECMVTQ